MKFLTRKKKVVSFIAIVAILVNTCVCAQMLDAVPRSAQNETPSMPVHAMMHDVGMLGMDHSCCDEVTATDCCHTSEYLPVTSESFSSDGDFVAIVSSWPFLFTTQFDINNDAIDNQLFLVFSSPPLYLINCIFLN